MVRVFCIVLIFCIVLYMLCNRGYICTPKKNITYWCDPTFADEVRDILRRSYWQYSYDISETDRQRADITIFLVPRQQMDKFHRIPDLYPNGKPIRFSITEQSKTENPVISIDDMNWKYGVHESGLTLARYREYIINHEFGHALGYHHRECIAQVCPVMYQMTRGVPVGHIPNYQVTFDDYNSLIPDRFFKSPVM
jgi:Protein of unknown function (DUF3152)